ncbi:MAG: SDR family NAD(P)-dependent oxidoreductase [Oscillospiraceae bacterium]|nr:SDR family NAD(P)-dependent oxidoreductase [Oscillospiraceae bacterium]
MKYALFTGAGGGLGGAGARALAAAGWTVFAADINRAALEEIGQVPGIIPVYMNVTSEESIREAVAEVRKTTDTLQAVINFSGIHTMASMVEGEIGKTLQKMIDINVLGMVRVNRAFFGMIRAGGGRIINCSSECGYMKPQPFNGPYTVTKYAVEAYNDSLRRELMYLGVPVVKIQPGSFKTNMHSDASAGFEKLLASTEFYTKVLNKMRPLMEMEFKMANDPKYLVNALLKAVQADKPKINYRVKNSKLLGMAELVPDALLDAVYRVILK